MASSAAQPTRSHTSSWANILSMLAVAILSYLLYSRALSFAFFNDDPSGHFAWMESQSYGDYLRSSAEYGYYRPVVFIILQGLVDAIGYNARYFHALLLILNAANVALLWLLIFRLSGSRPYAWAVALIFAFVPFNYEAVAYVASLTHPLLLFWLLLTLLFYQQARRLESSDTNVKRLTFYGLALITLVLGLLTHENGLFIPLAIIGIEWLENPPNGIMDSIRRPFLIYLLPVPLFLFVWWSIPKTGQQTLPSLSEGLSNLVPFIQTLVFPLLPVLQLEASQLDVLAFLALVTILFTYLAARVAASIDLWLFGLAWFFFSVLPAILFLTPDYLYGSPRLHYLPAVGVAMLWAMPVLVLSKKHPDSFWEKAGFAAAGIVYVLAIIWPPIVFINCELDFYAETSRLARQMGAVGKEAGDDRELLFVNLPVFFSSYAAHPEGCPNPYPWTPVGAVLLPDYANAGDFVRFNGGPDRPTSAVTVDAYGPGWRTFGESLSPEELRDRTDEAAVYVFDLNAGDFFDLSSAWLTERAGDSEPAAVFGDIIALHSAGVALSAEADELLVNLAWQTHSGGDAELPLTAFVHVYDQDGRLLAQHDGPPANNFIPRTWWAPQDIIVDMLQIDLGSPSPSGIIRVAIGAYDPQTAERYNAQSGGSTLPDNIYVAAEFSLP